ncbi:metallophosphoesterase [Lentisphaerota bacterium ZTH]|nr:metallophosphoesterase [Lentisphaerota bacterium]WET07693.1 metallophosphoesterase [Lentisphaerota bacterium ZTH]
MHSTKKFYILLMVLCSICSLQASGVTVLATTDIHGHITGTDRGLLKLATLIVAEKEKAGPENTLLIDCGDTLEGTYSAYATQGEIMIKALNFLHYDAWIPGNHEFDLNLKTLAQRIRQFQGAVLAGNINCRTLQSAAITSSWKIFKRGGLKVAVIGLTMPGISWQRWRPPGVLQTLKMSYSLHRIMPEVRAKEPDIIILAQHLGIYAKGYNAYSLLADFPEINLVLGGHTHVEKSGQKIGPDNWYVQAGKHAECVAKIEITFDKKRQKAARITSSLLKVKESTSEYKKLRSLINEDLINANEHGRFLLSELKLSRSVGRHKVIEETAVAAMKWKCRVMGKKAGAVFYSNCRKGGVLKQIIPLTRKTIFDWYRFHDKVCLVDFGSRETFRAVLNEFKSSKSARFTPLILLNNSKNNFTVVLSSYLLAGAGGRLPLLHSYGIKHPEKVIQTSGIQETVSLYLQEKQLLPENQKRRN